MGNYTSSKKIATYEIRYVGDANRHSFKSNKRKFNFSKMKVINVKITHDITEQILGENETLTIRWLLSEVRKRYEKYHKSLDSSKRLKSIVNTIDDKSENSTKNSGTFSPKKGLIVGLKSVAGIPALDMYLTNLDNSLSPIKHNTKLTVCFAKMKKASVLSEAISQDDFKYIKVIGKGGYSKVVLARKKDTGRLYAIKIMKKHEVFGKADKSTFVSEVEVHKQLMNTKFIMNLHYAFQTDHELYLVTEYGPGGSLFYYMNHYSSDMLNEEIVKFYAAEIVLGLENIHKNKVIYRDLKPENVLIDTDGHIKLSDFGLSKKLKSIDEKCTTFGGSPEYLSPEMLKSHPYTRAIDIYSLGGLIFELLGGVPPFYSEDLTQMSKSVLVDTLQTPFYLSNEAESLLKWLLQKDPAKRPTDFQKIKAHPFFSNIDWEKVNNKEVIPPWVPSLYKTHFSSAYADIPVETAFGKQKPNNVNRSNKRIFLEFDESEQLGIEKLYNGDKDLKADLKTKDRSSHHRANKYLEGFDFTGEPKEELDIKECLYESKPEILRFNSLGYKDTKDTESDPDLFIPGLSEIEEETGEFVISPKTVFTSPQKNFKIDNFRKFI